MSQCSTALFVASLIGILLHWPVAADDTNVVTQLASPAIASDTKWSLRLPQEDGPVVYRGSVSFDEAGTSTSPILYPAPNVGGFLAAVVTHALLVDSTKKTQKENLQRAANQVLSPYKMVLDNFKYRDLMQRAVKKTSATARLIEGPVTPGQEMVVESDSSFTLTQDQKAIILENGITVHLPGAAPESAYHSIIRVVSAAQDAADLPAFWTAGDGEKIKDESAELVAKSLEIAFHDMATGAASIPAFRTIRYQEGATEKIERAQVLSNQCDRMLIRTLRGQLMSVPASRLAVSISAGDGCGTDATLPN